MTHHQKDALVSETISEHFRCMAIVASMISFVVGCAVLLGWALNNPTLKSIVPGLTSMNPLTALCFMLGGASLWLQTTLPAKRSFHLIAQFCSAFVTLAGLLIFCRYLFSWPITIDQYLFHAKLGTNLMASNTAATFFLLGASLLLLDMETRPGFRPAQFFLMATGLISLLALIGYAYGIKPFYYVTSYIAMALNTAMLLFILSLGILFARVKSGVMAIIASDTTGGIMARHLMPAAIGIPLMLGWLRLAGQHAGIITLELGVTLFTLTFIIFFVLLIWWNARMLFVSDILRRQADENLCAGTVELFEAHNMLSTLIEASPLAIIGLDAAGNVTSWNSAAGTLFQWTADEVLGAPPPYISDDTQQEFQDLLHQIISGETLYGKEVTRNTKTGLQRTMRAFAAPQKASDGTIIGMIVLFEDISDRKRMEMAMEANESLWEGYIKSTMKHLD